MFFPCTFDFFKKSNPRLAEEEGEFAGKLQRLSRIQQLTLGAWFLGMATMPGARETNTTCRTSAFCQRAGRRRREQCSGIVHLLAQGMSIHPFELQLRLSGEGSQFLAGSP